ncbi:MAG: hypothetical protein KDD28_27045 [Phaeodactylibacter sp.]|nr:hypothetical protein [Phaeodactylibacter sp.]
MTIAINQDENLTLPDSWNEMDNRQLLTVYQLLFQDAEPLLSATEVLPYKRIQVMQALTGWDDNFLAKLKADMVAELGEEEGKHRFSAMLHNASKDVSAPYLETNEEGASSVRLSLTRNPYPEFTFKHRGRRRSYYGPADELGNLSIYELCVAFTLFEAYLKNPGDDAADTLIATLWRPPKPSTPDNKARAYQGDRRLPYQGYEAATDGRKNRIRKLPPIVKKVILFYFASSRQQIISGYQNLFSQDKRQVERVGNDYGWGAMLIQLAGGLANLETIGTQSWQNAFTYLSYLEDQRKLAEMRRQAKR